MYDVECSIVIDDWMCQNHAHEHTKTYIIGDWITVLVHTPG